MVQCQQLNGGHFMLVITDAEVLVNQSTPDKQTAITTLAILLAGCGVTDHLAQACIAIGITVRSQLAVLHVLPVEDCGE